MPEEKKKKEELYFQDAPASLSFIGNSPEGFSMTATFRFQDHDELLNKIISYSQQLKQLGLTVQEARRFGGGAPFIKKEKDWIPGRSCPKDGGRLYKLVTKTGKTMIKCENSKYDFQTKTASGCDFVEWDNPTIATNNETNQEDGSLAFTATLIQKTAIRGLINSSAIDLDESMVEALSKDEARAIITGALGK